MANPGYLSLTVIFGARYDGWRARGHRSTQRLKDLIESGYGLMEQETSAVLTEERAHPQRIRYGTFSLSK